jgi:hypothetical protein
MTDDQMPSLPPAADLSTERAREAHSERWLLVRQLVIALTLVALLVAHTFFG